MTPLRSFPVLRVCVVLAAAAVLAGCAGTRAAYQAAETLDETAYVVAEHYAALLEQVNELAEAGTLDADDIRFAQSIAEDATPAIIELEEAVAIHARFANLQSEADLEAALARAVPYVSRLANLLRNRSP